jgi:hypothetical protein
MANARASEGQRMGPVNWLAVILAAAVAAMLLAAWRRSAAERTAGWPAALALLLVPAAMLGHMFARISPGKPWLYPMMAGGAALAFVAPALWLALAGAGIPARRRTAEIGFWLVAYLAMGAVFWALR